MGWGNPPHEGYEARVLRDGRLISEWSAETNRESTGHVLVCCSCGWRGGRYRDSGLNAKGKRWWPDLDADAEMWAAFDEWRQEHLAPLVDPDPDSVLVLGEDAGDLRHFLADRPVHAGTYLELRLPDDRWVVVRYEWNWDTNVRPRAHLALGGRGEALGYVPVVEFSLPENAEVRWPAEPLGRRLL
jgi:hypothetical protein